MACTGIDFCKLAIGETKVRAQWLYEELERRMPGFDEEIRIHVNGCPNSCARFQVADIGLMSALKVRPDGTRSDAFLVHLGGGVAEHAADYVQLLIGRYLRQRRPEQASFGDFVTSLDDERFASFARAEGTR